MSSVVYRINIGKHSYIGSTKNFESRILAHKTKTKTSHLKLYQILRKRKWKNATVEILCNCEENEKFIKEQHYCNLLKPTLNIYNPVHDKEKCYSNWNKDIYCECGGKYTSCNKSKHMKTAMHVNMNKSDDLMIWYSEFKNLRI
jgi:hypothetical protein